MSNHFFSQHIYRGNIENISDIKLAVNWHMVSWCNYNCIFCFAYRVPGKPLCLDLRKSYLLLEKLAEEGVEKINFTGGEPLLCRNLGKLLVKASDLGIVTSIVTNGYYLAESLGIRFLESYGKYIDWIGVSLDSGREEVELRLGRGKGDHVKRVLKAIDNIRRYTRSTGIKINTVVTKLNYMEDMHDIIRKINPDRWKVFQLKIVNNVNNNVEWLIPSEQEFMEFVERHIDLNPVHESNTMMTNSYIMIDAAGYLYDEDETGYRRIGSILEHEIKELIKRSLFNQEKYIKRGAIYRWRRSRE